MKRTPLCSPGVLTNICDSLFYFLLELVNFYHVEMDDDELFSELLDAAEYGDVRELTYLLRAPNAKRVLNRGLSFLTLWNFITFIALGFVAL